jgi:predicted Zn-dependent protease
MPHLLALLILAVALPADAAPFRPTDDAQVLERVAPRDAADARTRETQALRAMWQREPRKVELAVQLARRWFDDGLAQGDPRFIGHAQAVLAPWWNDAAPPNAVRVQRARLLQYGHRFDQALADLDAVLADEPDNAEAWATSAAIRMVRADYAGARRACVAAAPLTTPLLATGCTAYADALAAAPMKQRARWPPRWPPRRPTPAATRACGR